MATQTDMTLSIGADLTNLKNDLEKELKSLQAKKNASIKLAVTGDTSQLGKFDKAIEATTKKIDKLSKAIVDMHIKSAKASLESMSAQDRIEIQKFKNKEARINLEIQKEKTKFKEIENAHKIHIESMEARHKKSFEKLRALNKMQSNEQVANLRLIELNQKQAGAKELADLKSTNAKKIQEHKAYAKTAMGAIFEGTTFGHKLVTTSMYAAAGSILYGAAGAVTSIKDSVIEADKYMHMFMGVLEMSEGQAKTLQTSIFNVGKEIGGTVQGMSEAALMLGRAGIANEKLAGGLKVAAMAANIAGDSIENITEMLAAWATVYPEENLDHLGDVMAKVANESLLSIDGLKTATSYITASGAAAGITADSLIAMAGAWKMTGKADSIVGTEMRRFFMMIEGGSEDARKAYWTLGIDLDKVNKGLKGTAEESKAAMLDMFSKIKAAKPEQLKALEEVKSGMNVLEKQTVNSSLVAAQEYAKMVKAADDASGSLKTASDKIALSYEKMWERIVFAGKEGATKFEEGFKKGFSSASTTAEEFDRKIKEFSIGFNSIMIESGKFAGILAEQIFDISSGVKNIIDYSAALKSSLSGAFSNIIPDELMLVVKFLKAQSLAGTTINKMREQIYGDESGKEQRDMANSFIKKDFEIISKYKTVGATTSENAKNMYAAADYLSKAALNTWAKAEDNFNKLPELQRTVSSTQYKEMQIAKMHYTALNKAAEKYNSQIVSGNSAVKVDTGTGGKPFNPKDNKDADKAAKDAQKEAERLARQELKTRLEALKVQEQQYFYNNRHLSNIEKENYHIGVTLATQKNITDEYKKYTWAQDDAIKAENALLEAVNKRLDALDLDDAVGQGDLLQAEARLAVEKALSAEAKVYAKFEEDNAKATAQFLKDRLTDGDEGNAKKKYELELTNNIAEMQKSLVLAEQERLAKHNEIILKLDEELAKNNKLADSKERVAQAEIAMAREIQAIKDRHSKQGTSGSSQERTELLGASAVGMQGVAEASQFKFETDFNIDLTPLEGLNSALQNLITTQVELNHAFDGMQAQYDAIGAKAAYYYEQSQDLNLSEAQRADYQKLLQGTVKETEKVEVDRYKKSLKAADKMFGEQKNLYKKDSKEYKAMNILQTSAKVAQLALDLKDAETTEQKIAGYSALAGAAAGFFEEGSKGAKAMQAISATLGIAQGIQAIISAWGSAPFPANMPAVAATTAAVLPMIGQLTSLGGSGGSGGASAVGYGSFSKKEMIEAQYDPQIDWLEKQVELLEAIDKNGEAQLKSLEKISLEFTRDIKLLIETSISQVNDGGFLKRGAVFKEIGKTDFRDPNKFLEFVSGITETSKLLAGRNEFERSISFDKMMQSVEDIISDSALSVSESVDELSDAKDSFKEIFDGLTNTATYATKDLQKALKDVNNLAGASLPNYLARNIAAIEAIEDKLGQSISTILTGSDYVKQMQVVTELQSELGITLTNGAKGALDYIESIELVSEAMTRSIENTRSLMESLSTPQQNAESLAWELGVNLATNVEELSALLTRLSTDFDGLNDKELELINANRDLLTSTDKYKDELSSLNKTLDDAKSNISILDSAFNSITSTIEKLRDASKTGAVKLSDFYESMANTQALSKLTDYKAFSESLSKTTKLSDALFNSSNFGSSAEMQFAQYLAANQFETLGSQVKTDLDYLRNIEENTATQIEAINNMGDTISKAISEALLKTTSANAISSSVNTVSTAEKARLAEVEKYVADMNDAATASTASVISASDSLSVTAKFGTYSQEFLDQVKKLGNVGTSLSQKEAGAIYGQITALGASLNLGSTLSAKEISKTLIPYLESQLDAQKTFVDVATNSDKVVKQAEYVTTNATSAMDEIKKYSIEAITTIKNTPLAGISSLPSVTANYVAGMQNVGVIDVSHIQGSAPTAPVIKTAGQLLAEKISTITDIGKDKALSLSEATKMGITKEQYKILDVLDTKGKITLSDLPVLAQKLTGFETGGYTGNVPTDAVAGIVHGKEYVVNAQTTKDLGLNNSAGVFAELLDEIKNLRALTTTVAASSVKSLSTQRAMLGEMTA